MSHSSIPLILHQTWKNRRIDSWSNLLRESVEKWLEYVVSDDMAYFFWEDDGIMRLLAEFEPDFVDSFAALPANVERTDVFRILVLKWFGGIVRLPQHCSKRHLALSLAMQSLIHFSTPTSTRCPYVSPSTGSPQQI